MGSPKLGVTGCEALTCLPGRRSSFLRHRRRRRPASTCAQRNRMALRTDSLDYVSGWRRIDLQ